MYFRFYDSRNLDHFNFTKIKAHYQSEEYNYVIGTIKLSALLEKLDVLNTADVFLAATGK